MGRTISYSTVGFVDRSVTLALDAIAEVGFNQAELFCEPPHFDVAPTGDEARAIGRGLAARGLGATVHAPLGCHLIGDADEDWRAENVSVLNAYLRFAGTIGAAEMIVHPLSPPATALEPKPAQSHQQIADSVRRSLDDLIDVARDATVRILMENLPLPSTQPLRTMRALRSFIEDYPRDVVGLVVDVGHAAIVGADPASEIHDAGDRLHGTHLQDIDIDRAEDNHWIPTHGGLDWQQIHAALADVRYAGPWTFEVANAHHGETPDQLCAQARAVAASWPP